MDTSQAVTVVPILAPIITPADSTRVSKPALTKLTVITVVAEEDCTRAVIRNPVKTPRNLFLVIELKICLILLPAAFCIPSLITFIPKIKNPRAPKRFKKSYTPNCIFSYFDRSNLRVIKYILKIIFVHSRHMHYLKMNPLIEYSGSFQR